jgi:hypothetical protein
VGSVRSDDGRRGVYSIGRGEGRASREEGTRHSDRGTAEGDWSLKFETVVTTSHRTLPLHGTHVVDGNRPLGLAWSKSKTSTAQTAAIASVLSCRGTSIAVGDTIPHVWSMARTIAKSWTSTTDLPEAVKLVQRFLATEISPEFELIDMLSRGIGVHHAGLCDGS